MNKPHKTLQELQHPNHETLPDDLKYFASCLVNLPQALSKEHMTEMLKKEGHKTYFILNVTNHVENMKNMYHLWQIQVLRTEDFSSLLSQLPNTDLNPKQLAVLNAFKSSLSLREQTYDSGAAHPAPTLTCTTQNTASSSLSARQSQTSSDWTKVISITGKPGTGKSKCLHACIEYAVASQLKCLVATPTGFLASTYRALFDTDVDANTIHSSFSIPIDSTPPKINWSLSTYDVIIIDEVSMVPLSVFTHIMATLHELPTRPVVVICGDKFQMPPIVTQNESTVNAESVYHLPTLNVISNAYNLTQQYRCTDQQYSEILDHRRWWKPTAEIMRVLQQDRLLHDLREISDRQLLSVIRNNLSSTFLAVSRNAVSRINNLILQNLFPSNSLLAAVKMDDDEPPKNIYRDMRVLITQNRDKKNGVVNGQPATVVMVQGATIILKLPNGKKVSVYPVSAPATTPADQDDQVHAINTCYPFVPGYAITICKSQGQTIENAIVWFDTEILGPGAAYVALSRVKTLDSIKFLTPLQLSHFKPVAFET